MNLPQITLFDYDLAQYFSECKTNAKHILTISGITANTSNDDLETIKKKALNSVWKLTEVTIDDEPFAKSSFEANLDYNEAMNILRQASMGGNNLATFASYTYKFSGPKELLTSSQGGYQRITILGNLSTKEITITVAIPGTITPQNIDQVKTSRDQILASIKNQLAANYSFIEKEKANLNTFISQTANGVFDQKVREKNTNDLL